MKIIFNNTNAPAQNSQLLLNFLKSYQFSAVFRFACTLQQIWLSWEQINNAKFCGIISSSYSQMPPFPWGASQLACEVHISHEQITPGACPTPPPVPHTTCMGFFWGSAQAHPKQQSHHPAGGQVAEREKKDYSCLLSHKQIWIQFFFVRLIFLESKHSMGMWPCWLNFSGKAQMLWGNFFIFSQEFSVVSLL